MTYDLYVAGLKRKLTLSRIGDDRMIAGFVLLGDVELTEACASDLLRQMPECDILIAPEAKAIPLIYEMARQSGRNHYLVARKSAKAYMNGVFSVRYTSITTKGEQELFLDGKDAEKMNGKRVVIIDDVVSTGESLGAVEKLVCEAGGEIVGKMSVLAEGDSALRDDLIFLAPLPLFDGAGNPI